MLSTLLLLFNIAVIVNIVVGVNVAIVVVVVTVVIVVALIYLFHDFCFERTNPSISEFWSMITSRMQYSNFYLKR